MTTPTRVMFGTFSLYEKDDGGLHISYRPDGDTEDKHIDFPGHIVKMAKMAAEGKLNPMQMITRMRSGQ